MDCSSAHSNARSNIDHFETLCFSCVTVMNVLLPTTAL